MMDNRYLALDGLRGVAAICVALIHAQFGALHGYLAVDLFFIISGFVIASSYEGRLQSGELTSSAYMRTRIWRLYPMLFLSAVVGVAVYALGGSDFHPTDNLDLGLALISQFALIPLLSSAPAYFAFNNPPWSIVWEVLANWFHAIGINWLSNRVLWTMIVIAAVGLVAMSIASGGMYRGCMRSGAWLGLPRVAFGFSMGILLRRTMPHWAPYVPQVPFTAPALIFFMLVSIPPELVPVGPIWALYDPIMVIFLFGPLVMLTARAKGSWIAAGLGTLSYPLYAINEPVLFWLIRADVGQEVVGLALLALFAAAWAIGKWVDEPLNQWRRLSASKSAARNLRVAEPLAK